MSYKNQSYRILFPLFAAVILFATLFLQAAHAENSDAQAPEYAVKYDNWKAEQFAASISYSDDLALQYASQNGFQKLAEDEPVTYSGDMTWVYANLYAQIEQVESDEADVVNSDALALAYASRFEPLLQDNIEIEYSNDLALSYANANQFAQIEAAEVEYSDALALAYASRFEPLLRDNIEIEYSNDLALSYANANQFAQVKADEVEYSDALALAYAGRFEPSLLGKANIEYSNDLALSYASQYGNFTTESFTIHNRTIRLDVAEAGTRFVFDDAPVFEDGMPAYGNSFVTEGYLYPAGTLSESNGVLPNGDPEFPELVIGRWTCRGWFIGDGAHTTSGPWVITTQVYDFDETVGAKSIITDGLELSDIGVAGQRAITGGTGIYSQARGNMTQTLIGFNETMGVNLHVTINPSR